MTRCCRGFANNLVALISGAGADGGGGGAGDEAEPSKARASCRPFRLRSPMLMCWCATLVQAAMTYSLLPPRAVRARSSAATTVLQLCLGQRACRTTERAARSQCTPHSHRGGLNSVDWAVQLEQCRETTALLADFNTNASTDSIEQEVRRFLGVTTDSRAEKALGHGI